MLQQTQVKTVLRYWERWMAALPDIAALVKASPEALHKLWEGMGYYTRVRNMQRAAQVILEKHAGRFPEKYEEVLELPGIGRYTAGAICSIAFNQPKPILDGNVIRVLARVFAVGGDPRDKTVNARLWELAEDLVRTAAERRSRGVNPGTCSQLNQALMELGALVCTPRQPRCDVCPVAKHCLARRQGRVEEFPEPARRAPLTPRRFAAFVIQERGRFLVRQRPVGVVNAHLWEFPNFELGHGASVEEAARNALGGAVTLTPLRTFRYTITRYRITLEVFRVKREQQVPALPLPGRWLPLERLRRLPFTAAHKRIIEEI